MTLKNSVKYSVTALVIILICSIVITLLVNTLISPKDSLFANYIDYLFYVDLIVLFIGCIMYIGQSGTFNSISYTTNLFKVRIFPKYKHELMASADIEENEISTYLKKTYLQRKIHYKHTYHVLIPSALIFIALMTYVFINY